MYVTLSYMSEDEAVPAIAYFAVHDMRYGTPVITNYNPRYEHNNFTGVCNCGIEYGWPNCPGRIEKAATFTRRQSMTVQTATDDERDVMSPQQTYKHTPAYYRELRRRHADKSICSMYHVNTNDSTSEAEDKDEDEDQDEDEDDNHNHNVRKTATDADNAMDEDETDADADYRESDNDVIQFINHPVHSTQGAADGNNNNNNNDSIHEEKGDTNIVDNNINNNDAMDIDAEEKSEEKGEEKKEEYVNKVWWTAVDLMAQWQCEYRVEKGYLMHDSMLSTQRSKNTRWNKKVHVEKFFFKKNNEHQVITHRYYSAREEDNLEYHVIYDATGNKSKEETRKHQKKFIDAMDRRERQRHGYSYRGCKIKPPKAAQPSSERKRGRPKGSRNKILQTIIVEGKRNRKKNIKRF